MIHERDAIRYGGEVWVGNDYYRVAWDTKWRAPVMDCLSPERFRAFLSSGRQAKLARAIQPHEAPVSDGEPLVLIGRGIFDARLVERVLRAHPAARFSFVPERATTGGVATPRTTAFARIGRRVVGMVAARWES